MIIVIIITAILIAAAVTERILYDKALDKIPLRILVNGTRGKTSVTRLIAATLNSYGIKTYAKTTGSQARWILWDGSEVDFRKGRMPNMLEQRSFLRMASKNGAQAIAIECMALKEENQALMANVLVRQHYTVITNAYVDHLEEIGWTKEETVSALAKSVYKKSRLITAEKDFINYADVRIIPVCEDKRSRKPQEENIMLVKALAQELNIAESYVVKGAENANPDIGLHDFLMLGDFLIHNAFAANDPASLLGIIKERLNKEPYILLYNHRSDRPLRLRLLADALQIAKPALIGVIGENKRYAAKYLKKRLNVNAEKVKSPMDWILSKKDLHIKQILCAGNIKGEASEFIDELMQRDLEHV